MSEVEFRKCQRCGKILPVSEFYKHSGRSDGLQAWCKTCKSEYAKLTSKSDIRKEYKLDFSHDNCRLTATEDEIVLFVNNNKITEEELDTLNGMMKYAKDQAS